MKFYMVLFILIIVFCTADFSVSSNNYSNDKDSCYKNERDFDFSKYKIVKAVPEDSLVFLTPSDVWYQYDSILSRR